MTRIKGTYLDAVLLAAVLGAMLAAGMGWRRFAELVNGRAGLLAIAGFFVLVLAKVAKRVLARVGPSGVELEVDRRGRGDGEGGRRDPILLPEDWR